MDMLKSSPRSSLRKKLRSDRDGRMRLFADRSHPGNLKKITSCIRASDFGAHTRAHVSYWDELLGTSHALRRST
jgi:hypothetical protein